MRILLYLLLLSLLLNSCFLTKVKEKPKAADKSIRFDTLSINQVKNVGENLIKHRVSIFNGNSRNLPFSFKVSGGKLDTFSVDSQKQWISPYSQDNPLFKVKTGKKVTSATLELGKKYILFFNEQKKAWDIKAEAGGKNQ